MYPNSTHRRTLGLVMWTLSILFLCTNAQAENEGRFDGRVVVEWLTNDEGDRDMRLFEQFTYTDPAGKSWHVPEGAIINGASIPRAFWTLVGPPFVGDYRRASVVHDYYCDVRTETWQAVHKMFYHASLTGGVPELQAKIMYAAVRGGGPRWREVEVRSLEGAVELFIIDLNNSLSEESALELEAWIESENPDVNEIEERVESFVTTQ